MAVLMVLFVFARFYDEISLGSWMYYPVLDLHIALGQLFIIWEC